MSPQNTYSKNNHNGRVFIGLVLLAIGGLLLLQNLDLFFFPSWLFGPFFLIALGLYFGAKHNYRKPFWFILVLLGLSSIFNHLFDGYRIREAIWPSFIILIGLWLILRRNHRAEPVTWEARMNQSPDNSEVFNDGTKPAAEPLADEYTKDTYTKDAYTKDAYTKEHFSGSAYHAAHNNNDVIECTCVFSSTKRTVLSKTFKGGDIINVLGGVELDLTQADIEGRVYMDITQLLSGIKLIVPPHWQVVPELTAVFSGVDDKRKVFGSIQQSPDKVLVLKGTSILAGIDIRSY